MMFSVLFAFVALVHASELNASDSLTDSSADTVPSNPAGSSVRGYSSSVADAYASLSVLQEFINDTEPAVSSSASSVRGYPSTAADACSSGNLLKEFIKDTEPLTLGPQETPNVVKALEVGTERRLYHQVLREEILVASIIAAILAILLAYFVF